MVRENCFWRGSRGLSSRLWRYKGVATQKTPATNRRFQFGTTGLFVGMAVVAVLMASVAFELRTEMHVPGRNVARVRHSQ